MLISRIQEDTPKVERSREPQDEEREYQTASELFDIMAQNHHFDPNENDALTTRDLVILYKNIDLGTKLMTNANEIKRKRPNQYVETIVYNDEVDSDGSDISENFSNDDLRDVFTINKERIDLLNSGPSLENSLCHKLGNLEIRTTEMSATYDRHFIFKDPYIKEQLKSLNLMASSYDLDGSILPTTLLDYICCKRLEDNYNFYMDNIIKYVKHTIEQLKRISNGDYLTDRAKEKWKEVDHKIKEDGDKSKVLATSTSIPLHVERKFTGHKSTWDDLVHSEMDIRSLSKILEKKIVLEIPKLIFGSYKLFSKHCEDNLIISCKRESPVAIAENDEEDEPRVDVILKLKRSSSGHVMSNISSIMILHTTTCLEQDKLNADVLPITYNSNEELTPKIIELQENNADNTVGLSAVAEDIDDAADSADNEDYQYDEDPESNNEESFVDTLEHPYSENDYEQSLNNNSNVESSGSSSALKDVLEGNPMSRNNNDTPFDFVSPDELRMTMQSINMSSLPEESVEDLSINTRKKSQTRVRIKSPYENQSYAIEEKKRKKLLEIRERREKKKMALSENCKVNKHKYGKGTVTPQPSSSVTKLSITNKSFYNSIYGQNINIDNKPAKIKGRKVHKKETIPENPCERTEEECKSPMLTPDKNNKKYINRSYYLDEAVTEMMYMDMKKNEGKDIQSGSTSVVSNDFNANLTMLTHLITAPLNDFDAANMSPMQRDDIQRSTSTTNNGDGQKEALDSPQSSTSAAPNNKSDVDGQNETDDPRKVTPTVECRKSIDKIYDLMKKLGQIDANDSHSPKSKFTTTSAVGRRVSSTIQGSDSGTSIKHYLTSSDPSCFSFDKINNAESQKSDNPNDKKYDSPTAIVPKVIINAKVQINKTEGDKNKKDRKKLAVSPPLKTADNPLKAISQLLHEFENVQKNKQKTASPESKPARKAENTNESKAATRQALFMKRRSRLDQHVKDVDAADKSNKPQFLNKKPKSMLTIENPKIPHQQIIDNEKQIDKISKKKITELLDEAKEARGEAVRGPSKINSRLNTLAQPKKSYVQAHSEEYQIKYGRNLMADRLQRLAAVPQTNAERMTGSANSKSKQRRANGDASPATNVKSQQPVPPIERIARGLRDASSSPIKILSAPMNMVSYKHNAVSERPEIKKKMVAVETYVKSHYGRPSSVQRANDLSHGTYKSRAPLLPHDIDLASLTSNPAAEESTAIGNNLHRIIDTMLNFNPTTLNSLAVSCGTNSRLSKEADSDSPLLTENISKVEDLMTTDSDYRVDIFEDKNIVTAVENIPDHTCQDKKTKNKVVSTKSIVKFDPHTFNSETELSKLEKALSRRISMGTIPKRLRIKNLTLTPKQSMQHVILLQSGDAGSLVVKSTLSQNIKINPKPDSLMNLKDLPVLSKTHMDWSFATFPMQIATVGYAFPKHSRVQCVSQSNMPLDDFSGAESENNPSNEKCDKDIQCFTGGPPEATADHFSQANSNEFQKNNITATVKNEMTSQQTSESKSEKTELSIETPKEYANEQSVADLISKATKDNHTLIHEEPIDYTTSLDMLVGLLNEIQKITTCQTNMTNTEHKSDQVKELELMLNTETTSHTVRTPCDTVSIPSLDKVRQLDINPSIYSLFMPNCDKGNSVQTIETKLQQQIVPVNQNTCIDKPVYVDKEVSVDIQGKDFVNKYTDVPSNIFPITINHSTNVTNSLIGLLSEPSSQSMFSFKDYHPFYNSTYEVKKEIIELPSVAKKDSVHKIIVKNEEKVEVHQAIEKTLIIDKRIKMQECKTIKKQTSVLSTADFDPLMKMKRDILVTVYSILVFTVFAALSFPELMYRV